MKFPAFKSYEKVFNNVNIGIISKEIILIKI